MLSLGVVHRAGKRFIMIVVQTVRNSNTNTGNSFTRTTRELGKPYLGYSSARRRLGVRYRAPVPASGTPGTPGTKHFSRRHSLSGVAGSSVGFCRS
eukprot:3128530-Rhodomonas_salina.1